MSGSFLKMASMRKMNTKFDEENNQVNSSTKKDEGEDAEDADVADNDNGDNYVSSSRIEKGLSDGLKKIPLIIPLAIIILYITSGTVIFHLWFDITYIDALYFTAVSFTTCGYGDITPKDDGQRIFTAIFIIIGIIVLVGIAMGLLFDTLFSAIESAIEDAEHTKVRMRVCKSLRKLSCIGGDENNERCRLSDDVKTLLYAAFPAVVINLVFGLVIGRYEGWSVLTAIYFSIITATSVGYGDVSPQTQGMRLLAFFYVPLSIFSSAYIFARVSGLYINKKAKQAEKEFLSRPILEDDFDLLDKDGDGSVTFSEYAMHMLEQFGKIDKKDIKLLKTKFDLLMENFDKDGDGKVGKEELFSSPEK